MLEETIMPNENLVLSIINAAKQPNPNWDSVDQKISLLKDLDSNYVFDSFYKLSDSLNANVMDAIASSLSTIKLSDSQRINQAIELLIPVCLSTDEGFVYASGRSALFLKQFEDKEAVKTALDQFKLNVKVLGVGKELIENIPNIEPLL